MTLRLVPAIVQDYLDATVLMMAWMNQESLQKLELGKHGFGVVPVPSCGIRRNFWTYSEGKSPAMTVIMMRWLGWSSWEILPATPVSAVVFINWMEKFRRQPTLSQLFAWYAIAAITQLKVPYTCQLFKAGDNKILKSWARNSWSGDGQRWSAGCDRGGSWLFYHTLVALAHHRVDLKDVYRKLQERRRWPLNPWING